MFCPPSLVIGRLAAAGRESGRVDFRSRPFAFGRVRDRSPIERNSRERNTSALPVVSRLVVTGAAAGGPRPAGARSRQEPAPATATAPIEATSASDGDSGMAGTVAAVAAEAALRAPACHAASPASRFHRRNEPIAALRHGLDISRLECIVAERLAQLRNGARQHVRRHERVLPRRVEQFFLGDKPVAVLDQVAKHVERLRLERNRLPCARHRHAAKVDRNVPKLNHFWRHHNFLIPPGNNLTPAPPIIS